MPYEKDWVDIMTALLTPTIAILGSVIAILQWRTNRLRLKHELFDKRYDVYTSAMAFIVSVVQNNQIKEIDRIAFLAGTKGAKFLFPKKINDYLDLIHTKACDLQCSIDELEGPIAGDKRAENIKTRNKIMKWFVAQLSTLADELQPFIELKH